MPGRCAQRLKVGDSVVPGDAKLLNVEDMGDECSGLSKGEVGIKWDKAGFLQEALKLRRLLW